MKHTRYYMGFSTPCTVHRQKRLVIGENMLLVPYNQLNAETKGTTERNNCVRDIKDEQKKKFDMNTFEMAKHVVKDKYHDKQSEPGAR